MSVVLSKMITALFHGCSIGSAVLMFYFAQPGSSLFSWHPFLMTTSVCLLMTEGLMVLSNPLIKKKATKVTLHWLVQGAAVAVMLAGFAVIYINKNANGKPHFTSWHGILGLVTISGAAAGLVAGDILKFNIRVPFVSKKTLKSVHALSSKANLILGYTVITLGLCSKWAQKEIFLSCLCGLGVSTVFMAGFVINDSIKVALRKKNKDRKN